MMSRSIMRLQLGATITATLVFTLLHMTYGATTLVATSDKVVGWSADTFGINSGHANSESNWEMWLDRLGVNAVRVFLAPKKDLRGAVGQSFGQSLSGTKVSNLAKLQAAVSQLRSREGHNPAAKWAHPVNWDMYERGFSKDKNPLQGNMNDVVSILNKRGITIQAQIGLSCSSVTRFQLYSFSSSSSKYWEERWGLYQYVYGLSWWMWNRGIKYVELYNEPDNDQNCESPEVYGQQVQIRAKAVRDAYADLNSEVAQNQRVNVVIGAPSAANRRFSGSLGQHAVENIHQEYKNGTSSSWKNFDEYTYHFYGGPGYGVNAFYQTLTQDVQRMIPNMPVSITEYNNYFGRNFELTSQTMDSADQAADFGDITAHLMFATKRMFVFKFSQTPRSKGQNSSGLMKNGLLFAENDVSPFDIGDSTRTFEVYHTIIQHCVNKRLYEISSPDFIRSKLTAWAVQDNGNWYFYLVNAYPEKRQMSINLPARSVSTGAKVLVNEISERYMNQIATIGEVDGLKNFNVQMSGSSITMLTVPIGGIPQEVSGSAVESAMVAAGSNQRQNYKWSNLGVKLSSGSNHDSTAVSYLKFQVGIDPGRISAAYLQLYVMSSGPIQSELLILGTLPSWSESSITWANAPNLRPLPNGKTIERISENPISYRPLPAVAGHLSIAAQGRGVQRVDVTAYLKKHSVQTASFQISRIKRCNANGQSSGDVIGDNSVTFASRSGKSSLESPKLVIFYK